MKYTFCPPKDTVRSRAQSRTAIHGTPLPPLADLIEQGKVVALNFPIAMNPGLARALGTMLKQDFQRAVLNRIHRMDADAVTQPWRPVAVRLRRIPGVRHDGRERAVRRREVLLAGAPGAVHPDRRDPEHQLAPVHAPGRVVAHAAAGPADEDLPDAVRRLQRADGGGPLREGRAAQARLHHHRGRAGRARQHADRPAGRAPDHGQRREDVQPRSSSTCSSRRSSRSCRTRQAIVLPYDGLNPLPPTYCYLKPYYLDVQTSYFDHAAKGAL